MTHKFTQAQEREDAKVVENPIDLVSGIFFM